jgi:hypothetical protein
MQVRAANAQLHKNASFFRIEQFSLGDLIDSAQTSNQTWLTPAALQRLYQRSIGSICSAFTVRRLCAAANVSSETLEAI